MLIVSGNRNVGGCGGLGCLLFGGLFLVGTFYFLNWLYFKLWYVAPVFLALALIINWRVVASSGRGFVQLLMRNPIAGILTGILVAAFFPLITIGWFFGAMGANKFEKMQKDFGNQWGFGAFDPAQVSSSNETEYAEFEEIESKPVAPPKQAD